MREGFLEKEGRMWLGGVVWLHLREWKTGGWSLMSNESMILAQIIAQRHLQSSKSKDRRKRYIGNVERNPPSHDSRKKDSQARADRVSGCRALSG